MALIGIAAWIAGFSYDSGYWGVLGWDSLSRYSLQETALNGFMGPLVEWLYAGLLAVFFAAYIFLLEFLSSFPVKKNRTEPAWVKKMRNWLQGRKKFDPQVKIVCVTLLLGGLGLIALVVLPTAGWVTVAYSKGQEHMKDEICQVRNSSVLPTKVNVGDEKYLFGRILLRSEKFIVLMDKTTIQVIATGDKSRVVDSTDVTSIACPLPAVRR